MATCTQCGQEFSGKRADAKYCTRACSARAERARYKAEHGTHRTFTWTDPDYHQKWRHRNRDKWAEYAKRYNDQARDECLARYGRACACCGITEPVFLTIDHVNDNGAEHRKTFTGTIGVQLRKEGYPEGYQTLCWNCQYGKRQPKGCPHRT